jgi:site-specific DNA recombinase
MADEMERERARQRTYDAMRRKAAQGYVTGGRVFGYRNRDVTAGTDVHGRPLRSHVVREIHAGEADVVRRIFTLCADGYGLKRIARQLNEDGVPSPRPQQGRPAGWAPSSLRAVLHRDLYRGVLVWNIVRKCDEDGEPHRSKRAEADWLRRDVPDLRIVPEALWEAAHARLASARATYLKGTQGVRWGRPPTGVIAKHLLSGIARCGVCGGGLTVRSRQHARARSYRYVCASYHYRGRAVCTNSTEVPVAAAEQIVFDLIEEDVLQPGVARQAVEWALEALQAPAAAAIERRTALMTDRDDLEGKLQRLADAIALGGDVPTLVATMQTREQRKAGIERELRALAAAAGLSARDVTRLRTVIEARVGDWRGLLTRQTQTARQVVHEVLAGKLTFTPTRTETGAPAYEVTAPLTYERMFSGFLRPYGVASPAGLEPATPGLGNRCSILLSYGDVRFYSVICQTPVFPVAASG